MSNFLFLKTQFSTLFEAASTAEKFCKVDPRTTCFHARRALEEAVQWLYQHDDFLKKPFGDSLNDLIHEKTFQDNLGHGLFAKLRAIQKLGNSAVHNSTPVPQKDAVYILKELHHFCYWLYRGYSEEETSNQVFDAANIPTPLAEDKGLSQKELLNLENKHLQAQKEQAEKIRLQEKELKEAARILKEKEEAEKLKDDEIAALKAQLAEQALEKNALLTEQAKVQKAKEQNQKRPDTHDYNEAETRHYLIDQMLVEAGWNLKAKDVIEYPVTGMPTDSKKGKVDYVLWGDDGLPLAVVEAKRTSRNPEDGQHQAKLYADCLEELTGQRPIIFYTNGYHTHLWEDLNYPPREVRGFYKKDELKRLIDRRVAAKSLGEMVIQEKIVNRHYQHAAIRSISDLFEKKSRKGLIVMATGAGKTRTTIALVDLLRRAGWVKNVLFLADRNALVNQAKKNFATHLPESAPTILKTGTEKVFNRICLSTYPTMKNIIEKQPELFSVGHFDLIVLDEAHRSVYNKYKEIFDYFDSLLIGLTATPKDEVDHNTYGLFDIADHLPTYSYELDSAIDEGYLVPAKAYDVPIKFMREGIVYSDLSEDEQEEYEMAFDDTGELIPEMINPGALNQWLFNSDTVDKALKCLMEYGIKTDGGDVLAKTIIFAKNTDHANFIQKRFDFSWPEHKGKFCQTIYFGKSNSENLIDEFSVNPKFRIAVSVDMLDTGVDIPAVCNLVLFKAVKSKVKFLQMLGRGTRLCPNIFAPGEDKEHFYVFDLCGNLSFFEENPEGVSGKAQKGISEVLFKKRLQLAEDLKEQNQAFRADLLDYLHSQVSGLNPDNFIIRPRLQQIEPYLKREAWDKLEDLDHATLEQHVAELPFDDAPGEELEKRFDLLMLNLQIAIEKKKEGANEKQRLTKLASALCKKDTIPAVKAKINLIQEISEGFFFENLTLESIEMARLQLRSLLYFIDPDKKPLIYTNIEDEIEEITAQPIGIEMMMGNRENYKRRAEAFIHSHEANPAIQKLRFHEPLTEEDLSSLEDLLFQADALESKEAFQKFYGEKSLPLFIRSIIGMDREAVQKLFSEFLQNTTYNPTQIGFVQQIVEHIAKNGSIEPKTLYESPFIDMHSDGVDGLFPDGGAEKIFQLISEL